MFNKVLEVVTQNFMILEVQRYRVDKHFAQSRNSKKIQKSVPMTSNFDL